MIKYGVSIPPVAGQVMAIESNYQQMKINQILSETSHRPCEMPKGNWRYYQEWKNVIFLHWQVSLEKLSKFIPDEFEIELFNGKPWVSVVAFSMENIRLKFVPSFPAISTFHEVNVRTYVKYKSSPGVYFLNMEGSKRVSCFVAKKLTGLPYRYSNMKRESNTFTSNNPEFEDHLFLKYNLGDELAKKDALDIWLTERYALFQDKPTHIDKFDIHHLEWPIHKIKITGLTLIYSRYKDLITGDPDRSHFSNGVQVIAWDKNRYKRV